MSEFLAAAHAAHAAHFPATITVDGATYNDATTSGWQGRDPLALGGTEAERRASFRVPYASLVAAGKALPCANLHTLTVTAPANMACVLTIDEVVLDPACINVTLRCTARPQ